VESVDGCAIDLVGAGDGRPTLEAFLRDTEYARLEWWPQRGAERVVTWQARRIEAPPGFEPDPYQRFGSSPEAAQQVIGILFTILGNLDDLSQARPKLEDAFDELRNALAVLPALRALGAAGALLAKVIALVAEGSVDAATMLLQPAAPLIKRELPGFFPRLLRMFVPLDADKDGAAKGQPQRFRD